MSDTPRTDAIFAGDDVVDPEPVRQMERELALLREQLSDAAAVALTEAAKAVNGLREGLAAGSRSKSNTDFELQYGGALIDEAEERIRARIPTASERALGLVRDGARLDGLAELYQHCPHAVLTWNDDPDAEVPLGYSISIQGCEYVEYSAATLRETIDAAIAAGGK